MPCNRDCCGEALSLCSLSPNSRTCPAIWPMPFLRYNRAVLCGRCRVVCSDSRLVSMSYLCVYIALEMSYTTLERRSREAFTNHCIQALDAISDNQADTLYSAFLKPSEDFFPSCGTLYWHVEYTQDFTRAFFGNGQRHIEGFAGDRTFPMNL